MATRSPKEEASRTTVVWLMRASGPMVMVYNQRLDIRNVVGQESTSERLVDGSERSVEQKDRTAPHKEESMWGPTRINKFGRREVG